MVNSPGEREVEKIDKKLEERLEEYDVYLPEKYEYIDGYEIIISKDPRIELHFKVLKEDFENLLGKEWNIVEKSQEKSQYLYRAFRNTN